MAKKILIVEDEPDVLEVLASRLQESTFEVVSAQDAVHAVRQAHRENPDLILLDINMPAGGGKTVYENLKNSAHTASIPVLFVSAIPEAELSQMAQELGAAGYLCKPYDPALLIAKIKEIVGE